MDKTKKEKNSQLKLWPIRIYLRFSLLSKFCVFLAPAIENSLHVLSIAQMGCVVRQIHTHTQTQNIEKEVCGWEWRNESVDVLPSKNKTCRMHSTAKLNMQHKKLELLFFGSLFFIVVVLFCWIPWLSQYIFFDRFLSNFGYVRNVFCVVVVIFFFCAIQINSDNIQRRESTQQQQQNWWFVFET